MIELSVRQAKAQFARLIDLVLAGEDVVITRRGVPVVRVLKAERRDPGRSSGD